MSNKVANVLTQTFTVLLIVSYFSSRLLGFPVAIGLMVFFAFAISTVRYLVEKQCRERLFEPLEERKLPRLFRKYVQRVTPEMERAGFESIGGFLIYPEPASLHSRAFFADDGRCFGYLAAKDNLCFYGFFSVFEDGTYLESSPLKPGSRQPAADAPIRMAHRPNASVDELWEFHRSQVAEIEQRQVTRAMKFTPEQYAEVSEYGFRLSDWDLYKQGARWTPPKAAQASGADTVEAIPAEERELVAL